MTFARLRTADWIAMAAALALLLVMAMDFYSTNRGEEARRIERIASPSGAEAGEVERTVDEDARLIAEGSERNAWQTGGLIDDLILLALLAAAGLALGAGFLRAANKRFEPPLTPSALAALAGGAAGLMLAYRMVQQPGLDSATTVQAGVPLAMSMLGVIILACVAAMRSESEGTAFREPPPEPRDPSPDERAAAREQARRERPA